MIDFDKFAKYSKAGPRYTSYPTAPEFHQGFTCKSYEEVLAHQDKSRKLSLYFHLPFCRSACYFFNYFVHKIFFLSEFMITLALKSAKVYAVSLAPKSVKVNT